MEAIEDLAVRTEELQSDPAFFQDNLWFDDVDYQLSVLEEMSDNMRELRYIPSEYESSYELLGTFEKISSKYTMLYRRTIRQMEEALFTETLIEYDKLKTFFRVFTNYEEELQVKY